MLITAQGYVGHQIIRRWLSQSRSIQDQIPSNQTSETKSSAKLDIPVAESNRTGEQFVLPALTNPRHGSKQMNWKGDVRSSPGPPSQFKTKLKNNAFAQALATPIRQCALTKARLPNAFLVEFTQRLHPDTMLPWLLPTDMRHVDRRAASRTPKKPIEYPTILNPSIEKGYVSNRVSVLKIANAMGRKGHHSSLEIWKKITHRHTESAQMPLGKTVWRPDMDSFISRLLRNRVLEEITALTDLSDEYLRSYKDPFCKVRFKSDVAVALRLSGWEADQNGKLPLAELGYQQRVNEKDNIPVLIYNLPKMGDDKWIAKLQEALKLDHSVEVISLKRSWGTLEVQKWLWKLYGYLSC